MYAIRKIFKQGQIFGLKFYFRPHGITRSERCIGTVLCKVWGSCPGVQKTTTLMFFPCLCISLCQQQSWHQSPGCVRLPLILLSNLHGHLSPFTYSCKPLTIIHHGTRKIILIIFFQWLALRFIYCFRRCSWHFYRSTPAMEICFCNTYSHMHHEADAVNSFMSCVELINLVNFFFFCALLLESREVALILGRPRKCLSS